jgi:hypothetical protein
MKSRTASPGVGKGRGCRTPAPCYPYSLQCGYPLRLIFQMVTNGASLRMAAGLGSDWSGAKRTSPKVAPTRAVSRALVRGHVLTPRGGLRSTSGLPTACFSATVAASAARSAFSGRGRLLSSGGLFFGKAALSALPYPTGKHRPRKAHEIPMRIYRRCASSSFILFLY